jgi:hypothetical protein
MPTKDEMSKFAKAIEEMVANSDYNYIEAIVEYCRETGLELEVAATLVNNNLKAKIIQHNSFFQENSRPNI